jgi:hypothetical protein
MVIDELMRQEPRFEINGRIFASEEVSPLFRELIGKYYMSFFMDAFDEIMTAGVVFVRIRRANSGDRVPEVVSSEHFGGRYDVLVRNEGGKNLYRMLKLQNAKGEPITPKTMRDIIPMDHFGGAPSATGQLNSRLVGLLDPEIYYQYAMRMSLQAEFTLSNPPVVTETRPEAPAALPTDERRIDYYLDDEFEDEHQRGIYRRDHATRKQVEDHFARSYANVATPQVSSVMGRFNSPLENNVRPLPFGHTVASQPMPSRNPEIAEMVRQYEIRVSSTYGVPRALVAQDVSVKTAGAVELVSRALRTSLQYWNNIGGQLLTAVYRCIYYPDDCNWIAGILPKKGDGMSEEELYQSASAIADVRVFIPLGPNGTLEENRALFDQGVITWDEYVSVARATNGFGAMQMPEQPRIDPAASEKQSAASNGQSAASEKQSAASKGQSAASGGGKTKDDVMTDD